MTGIQAWLKVFPSFGLPNEKNCVYCAPRQPEEGCRLTEQKHINTDKKVMKTIAILALTAAALVSCQQQQQLPTPTPEPTPVAPIKK